MKKEWEYVLQRLQLTESNYEEVLKCCASVVPQKLYKYRVCDKNGFDMLEKEYLWASLPDQFVDPLDSRIALCLKQELPELERWINLHLGEMIYYKLPPKGMQPRKGEHKLSEYIETQERFVDEKGKVNSRKLRKEMILEVKKFPKKIQDQFKQYCDYLESEEFKRRCTEGIKETLDNIVNKFRKSKTVCSLTKRNDNQVMWENYADNYRGFCVEYKMPNVLEINEGLKNTVLNLFPVKYYQRIPRVKLLPFIEAAFQNSLYGVKLDIKENENELFKQMLYKKYEYRYEEEWRLVLHNERPVQVPFPFVSAVYVGKDILEQDLERLKIICRSKQIPLYKQCVCLVTGEMRFTMI